MKYRVKWIEDNLGISRKALRCYEDNELLPKNHGKYREYSEEEIQYIWNIRVLQGIGYSLAEIRELYEDDGADFEASIREKIVQLKQKKDDVDRSLSYANTILLTGMMPNVNEVGSVRYEEFQEKVNELWIDSDAEQYVDILEKYENMSEEEFSRSNVGFLLNGIEKCAEAGIDFATMFAPRFFITEIMKRKDLSPNNPETQLLIKMYYEQYMSLIKTKEDKKESFARRFAASHMEGVLGRQRQQEYGKKACKYYADALAIFAGYKNYKELMEGN